MSELGLTVGDHTHFSKTVSESDVYLIAGIVGDFSANHVNEHAMRKTPFGGRIAHGALLVGYMSACSTAMANKAADNGCQGVPVALGFDRIRFLKPVRIGDTISIDYVVEKLEADSRRSYAAVTVTNHDGEVVAVAQHIIKWVSE
jgi:3-hydroxybutyryl-CoA dehydratase